jgi:eukaryotic-like serine/threonine-protein kinase
MAASPPTTIGKYHIIREIARSNDIVYEAYDPLMDRRVAVKELNIPAGTTPTQLQERIDRFEREARAAGRLAHPNIMTVYDVGTDGDRHYMAMEFLDGHTLRNDIDTRGAIPIDDAIRIVNAVLDGLEHAHANGVVHRDIKPDNIQILSSGQVKITDFGIARLTFQPNLTMAGQVFGTPSYMSPEQVKGGDIDARSDLFSVGILMYEMIAGEKPFQGDNVIAISHAILNQDPRQPSKMSYPLWRVTETALMKSPGQRYSSAKEMATDLEKATSLAAVDLMPSFQVTHMPSSPPPNIPAPVYPYNPYAPTPAPNPYSAPPPVVPGAPPNPYGSIAPPGSYVPPPGVPVYYPPPPKRPLLTPAQSAAIGRLLAIIVVVGTFMTMVVLAILFFVNQISQNNVEP